jgi:twitching motility protein PilT
MDIFSILKTATNMGASDIHLSVGTPPVFRITGNLIRWTDDDKIGPLTRHDTMEAVRALMDEEQFIYWQEKGEIDFSYSLFGVGRFRINTYRQRGCPSLAIRPVPYHIPGIETLGVSQPIIDLAEVNSGLVLVTGPTGSGKSTTLAALIDMINTHKERHIITIEDPIEYLHQHKKSVVDQRELGSDTYSFAGALRACLRQDPDVILIGEMRDLDTISTAITAAETGHLVFSTLHTISAAQSIERIIDVFPSNQQEMIKIQLASTLQAVVTQQLIPHSNGKSRILATEIMLGIPAIRNLIREGRTHQIYTVLQTGSRWGMQTMDSALRDLIYTDKITMETGLKFCHDKENFVSFVNQG